MQERPKSPKIKNPLLFPQDMIQMQPTQRVPTSILASQIDAEIDAEMMQDALQFCQTSGVQTNEHYMQRVTEYMSTAKCLRKVRKTILKEDQEILHVSFHELRNSDSKLAKYLVENPNDVITMFESELTRLS